MKKISSFLLFALILGLCLEVFSWMLLVLGLVPDLYKGLGIVRPEHLVFQGLSWRNEKSLWGAWHRPNSTSRHSRTCFDVTYHSNSIGARSQREFTRNANSITLLGDSFAEGYGVEDQYTVSNLLQTMLGKPVLNFGSAGDLGPVSYFLIYRSLASSYDSRTLVIFLLPANDFTDHLPDVKLVDDKGRLRYRPYFKPSGVNQYQWFIPPDAIKSEQSLPEPGWKDYLKSYTYLSNFRRLIKNVKLIRQQSSQNQRVPRPRSQWYEPNTRGSDAAIYFINSILKLSRGRAKSVYVFAIPVASDLEFWSKTGRKPESPVWYNKLLQLTRLDNRLTVINGFNYLPSKDEAIAKLFLQCDGHWSKAGNLWAAKILRESLLSGNGR